MMCCTIYSHHLGLEKIRESISKNFAKAEVREEKQDEFTVIHIHVKKGFLKGKDYIKIAYRERENPSFELKDSNCPLSGNLNGMLGLLSKIPNSNSPANQLLIEKVKTINCEFSLFIEPKLGVDHLPFVNVLIKDLEAFVFAQPGTLISKSQSQHFLDENKKLIIDLQGNVGDAIPEVKIDASSFDPPQDNLADDQIQRKEKSEKIVAESGVKVNVNLPAIDSEAEARIRTPKEIAERAVVLAMTNFVAFNNVTGEQALDFFKKYELDNLITPKERDFLNNPTDEKKNIESWKCEDIWVLMWALNKVPELGFPNVLADLNKIPPEEYPIHPDKDPRDFINSINATRSAAEILDANDLYYRLDWACVDNRINGRETQEVHPGVVYERHYALNWLINYRDQDWDDVSCDT